MNVEDMNKQKLKINYNLKAQKYSWEIWLNESLLLSSDREYDSEYDCKIHLNSIALAFRYLVNNGDLKL
jgi:hypothetical protein